MGQTALKNQIVAHYYLYRKTFGIKEINCIDYIPLCQHKINYYHKLTPRDINYALLHYAFICFHRLPIHWELNHSDWLLELPAAFFMIRDQLLCVIYASVRTENYGNRIFLTHNILKPSWGTEFTYSTCPYYQTLCLDSEKLWFVHHLDFKTTPYMNIAKKKLYIYI